MKCLLKSTPRNIHVVLILNVLVAGALVGCEAGAPDDVVNRQERQRMEQTTPNPTDMPPGLSADLPAPAATQPAMPKN